MPTKLLPLSKLTRPFLLKFFADPKKKWCVWELQQGSTAKRCALGHVYHACFGSANAMSIDQERVDELLKPVFSVQTVEEVTDINNGEGLYQQTGKTPRARILAALRAAGKKGK